MGKVEFAFCSEWDFFITAQLSDFKTYVIKPINIIWP